jgi:chromosome segregation ATPase
MPCTKCEEGKYKWGETGECKYDTLDACESANHKYNKMQPTPLGKKSYEEYEKELKEYNLSSQRFDFESIKTLDALVENIKKRETEGTKAIKDYFQVKKVLEKDRKIKEKESDLRYKEVGKVKKIEDSFYKAKGKLEDAEDKLRRMGKSLEEIEKRVERVEKEDLGIRKNMQKLAGNLDKFLNAFDKQLNAFKKNAKALGVDVPTSKYDKVFSSAFATRNKLIKGQVGNL